MISHTNADAIPLRSSVDAFLSQNPFFDEKLFVQESVNRFQLFNQSLENGDFSRVKPFLSNGLAHYVDVVHLNNQKADFKRTLGNVSIHSCSIDRIEQDGHLYVMYLHFEGVVEITEKGGFLKLMEKKRHEEFSTYWVMYRSQHGRSVDLLNCDFCPECNSPLNSVFCGHCGAALNSGRYGWVLSRIISEEDLLEQRTIIRSENLQVRQGILGSIYPNFTVHQLEDIVFSGFMQVIHARITNEPTRLRPIFSDRFYERESMAVCDAATVYRDFRLNNITLVAIERLHGFSNIYCNVSFTAQRVDLSTGKPIVKDSAPVQRRAILHMVRREPYTAAEGQLYEGTCPSCGMPIHYGVDVECPHCKNCYNSALAEWVIVDMLSYSRFEELIENGSHRFQYAINPRDLSCVMSIRDYVLNNVMVICASDRIITTEEIQFIDDIAESLGYTPIQRSKIHKFLRGTGMLRLRLPENRNDKLHVFELMKKAALVDNDIAPEEKRILQYIYDEIHKSKNELI